MHEYYRKNAPKFQKAMNGLLKPIAEELEQYSAKSYAAMLEEIWQHYEKNMLERFPYIGGDSVSGTKNLTGAYCFVSMGEVLKTYGVSTQECGRLVAEADRMIVPETIIRRTVQFSLSHYPELDLEGHWRRTVDHLHEKYAEGGYLRLLIPGSPNEAPLRRLRDIIRDEARLRSIFDTVFAEEARPSDVQDGMQG